MDTVVREFTIGYFVLCANGKDTGKGACYSTVFPVSMSRYS